MAKQELDAEKIFLLKMKHRSKDSKLNNDEIENLFYTIESLSRALVRKTKGFIEMLKLLEDKLDAQDAQ